MAFIKLNVKAGPLCMENCYQIPLKEDPKVMGLGMEGNGSLCYSHWSLSQGNRSEINWGRRKGNVFFTNPRTLNIHREEVILEASKEFLEEEL